MKLRRERGARRALALLCASWLVACVGLPRDFCWTEGAYWRIELR